MSLWCFPFLDFQLAPTLEEFERILGRTIKDHNLFPNLEEDVTPVKIALALGDDVQDIIANWDTKGIFKGFSKKFLEGEALKFVNSENWNAFNDVLALLVHGIVLFLNIDNFVDHLAVEIFLSDTFISRICLAWDPHAY